MSHPRKLAPLRRALAIVCSVLAPLLGWAGTCLAAPAVAVPAQDVLRLGERIYREGVLPSGEPLRASLAGGISAPGTSFACVSCHLRSGLGAYQEGVFTPPANGAKLFKSLQVYSSARSGAGLSSSLGSGPQGAVSYQVARRRPAYSDQSLAHALRDGIDCAGRTMDEVMPRYDLDDAAMPILISYLKSLSAEFSPGVAPGKPARFTPWKPVKTLRFATIVSEGVALPEQQALLLPLESYILSKSRDAASHEPAATGTSGSASRFAGEAPPDSKTAPTVQLSLSRWVLKGSPDTWREQLEKFNRSEPVFAILGGLTEGPWQPIHQFCEESRIPCLFPMTDFPVISPTDWYTLYFSKGYYQEGEGAARFLNDHERLQDRPVLQIVRDTLEGRTLSEGFLKAWRELGRSAPVTVTLKRGEALTAEFLQHKLAQEKPAALLLWDGPESVRTLELLAAQKDRPDLVLLSSSFLGKSMYSLSEQARHFSYLTYPYRISLSPEEQGRLPKDRGGRSMKEQNFDVNPQFNALARNRISQQSYILGMLLRMTVDELRGNYYRDYLLDLIGTIMELEVRLYERLSFGPGLRYASQGCYIVQLSQGGLVKKSGWLEY